MADRGADPRIVKDSRGTLMENKKAIAIITARGGSKRIPRKNIKDFCGRPILAYSIEAALNSGEFDTVMVSTDDEEIAGIAVSCGAEVPFFRSEETSNDHATTVDVLREVLGTYEGKGIHYEYACCIYPTAPFVTGERLKEAMEQLENTAADSLVPVVAYSFPPQRAFVIREQKVAYQYPEFAAMRSQDLETIYHDCGQFYLFRTEMLKKQNTLIGKNTIPYVMPETEVQDIDNESDWMLAEMKYKTFM